VAPSLLAVDFAELRHDIASLEALGADLLHLDVMDGHFVPNISFGPFICKAIKRASSVFLDAHLMISHPHDYVDAFVRSGVDALTIHVEADTDVGRTLEQIDRAGLKTGVSLNPGTPLAEIASYLPDIDLVLVMSVQPGFGGQNFDPAALAKIEQLAEMRRRQNHRFAISVDGGIDDTTAPGCLQAGADILVSGTYLCRAADRAAAMATLR